MIVENDKSNRPIVIRSKTETGRFQSCVNVKKTSYIDTDRLKEILAMMKSFGKEKYHKSELLTEMLALQQEIVELTFNDDHAAMANLKIWDVVNYLEQLNKECGYVADSEFKKFKSGSNKLNNLIKAEISGKRGEEKAFHTLKFIHSRNKVIKNVELEDGNLRTELDAVVITPGAITIIEVKNTAKNIFIDENGDYFRTGEYLKWDCNIAEKMALKEMLLRKKLAEDGVGDVQIKKVVVFTNKKVEVQNKYSDLRTCFVSQLPCIIDGFKSENPFSDEEIEIIDSSIKKAEDKEAYPFDFDVAQYKLDFATVMAVLEEASMRKNEAECEQSAIVKDEERNNVLDYVNKCSVRKNEGVLGGVAAAAALAIVSVFAIGMVKKAV